MTINEYIGVEIPDNAIVILKEQDILSHKLGETCEYIVGCRALANRPTKVRWTAFPGDYCEYTRCRDCPEWIKRKIIENN